MDDAPAGTVGDHALSAIRGDILFCRLAPDRRLTLDTLCAAYGVSVSALREVLCRLTAEDLVVAEGNKGFRVAPVSKQDLHDTADLYRLLEDHALTLSLGRGIWTGKDGSWRRSTSWAPPTSA